MPQDELLIMLLHAGKQRRAKQGLRHGLPAPRDPAAWPACRALLTCWSPQGLETGTTAHPLDALPVLRQQCSNGLRAVSLSGSLGVSLWRGVWWESELELRGQQGLQ